MNTTRTYARGPSAQAGVTLIEVIIYLALFGLLMGGAITAAYNLFESESRGQTKAMMQEEGGFLIGKINWALSGVQAVTAPAVGTKGSVLTVAKWDTTIGNPITIALTGVDITMATSSNLSGMTLNNSNVSVSNLLFDHKEQLGVGNDPESVQFSFTLSARLPDGILISESFPTSTVYLRQ